MPYSTRSRTIRNTASARASVPSLLYEESEPSDTSRPWVWRTDLSATKPFWENWFIGLSRKFLDARGGKLLLLAGTDRLDKELMIGQMQGMLSTILNRNQAPFSPDPVCCPLENESVANPHRRQIPAAGLSGSRPLHSGRPACQDGAGVGGLLPAQRSQRVGASTQSGRSAGRCCHEERSRGLLIRVIH